MRFIKELGRAVSHGVFNGGMRIVQGGKFIHGFLSGSFSSFAGSFTQAHTLGFAGGTIVSATIGGTAESLGGGKFANGAVTGAFTMMFNHLAQQVKATYIGQGISRKKYNSFKRNGSGGINIKLYFDDPGTGYTDFRWIQTVETSDPAPGKTSPYIDPDDNPL